MRAIVFAVMMVVAGAAWAGDFGVQLSVAEKSLQETAKPRLRRVECNPQRCVFQNATKDITAFIGIDDRKIVTGFYIFFRPTNWATAADYASQIQSALKVPASEIADVRGVVEAAKDGKQANANSNTVSCRSDGDGSTPTVICERR